MLHHPNRESDLILTDLSGYNPVMFLSRPWTIGLLIIASIMLNTSLTACERSTPFDLSITPASVWSSGQPATVAEALTTPSTSYILPTTRIPGSAILTPTPDSLHYQSSTERGPETYIVQPGDMLSAIAERYSVSVPMLVQANNLSNPDALEVGQALTIPVPTPQAPGPAFKLIPDSELVYGPLSGQFDIDTFIQSKHGYLADYTDVVNGETLTAAQAVQRAAQNFSVSPRILLAVLEYRSGWVTNPNPDSSLGDMPLGYNDDFYVGLYRQLVWAAATLNNGYYRWRSGAATAWVLTDGSVVPINPTINAGTAGVQNFFAQLDDYDAWLRDVSPGGFFDTFTQLFGYPFDLAIEPLVPANLTQPPLLLPFGPGEIWAFTGGPHPAWDFGSPFGALDFAPAETQGCDPSDAWITAMADGLVTRTGVGSVYQDLDGDGNEGSGWVILYMHVEARDRVQSGAYLRAGDRIGHPSCEGGQSSGNHLHIARKFNGEWISAIGPLPFNLGGWIASGTGEEGVGSLTRNGQVIDSYNGSIPTNQIQR
jgi:murein DD-endopeptidase MepM/ murein hydrolase activator NlpD